MSERKASAWPYREIYSIYTPSQQTGLSMRDIDGDGRIDILCGNYWIQKPGDIRTSVAHIRHQHILGDSRMSAMLAHAVCRGSRRSVAQAHMAGCAGGFVSEAGRSAQLWNEIARSKATSIGSMP